MNTGSETLRLTKQGDIDAFSKIFSAHEKELKSYLYRLLANRDDVNDFYQNTFLKAFENVLTFKGNTNQFKSWVFTIATRLSLNYLKTKKRWGTNAQDICRENLMNNPEEQKAFFNRVIRSEYNNYDIKEHIDFCFTCISKTLPIEQQVALLLKEVYDFKLKEIAEILGTTLGRAKHCLLNARNKMTGIYDNRCALINKRGTCHQCSELQGIFNPKSSAEQQLMKIRMVKDAASADKEKLFQLRNKIVASVNPLNSSGADLHHYLMEHLRYVNKID